MAGGGTQRALVAEKPNYVPAHLRDIGSGSGTAPGAHAPLEPYTLVVPSHQVAIPRYIRIPEVGFACSPLVHVDFQYSLKYVLRQIIIHHMDHVSENGATALHSIVLATHAYVHVMHL